MSTTTILALRASEGCAISAAALALIVPCAGNDSQQRLMKLDKLAEELLGLPRRRIWTDGGQWPSSLIEMDGTRGRTAQLVVFEGRRLHDGVPAVCILTWLEFALGAGDIEVDVREPVTRPEVTA